MKQVVQAGRDALVEVQDVPAPSVRPHHLLIRTTRSLISSGTERAVVETGTSGYLGRARQQPERVAKAMDKLVSDGLTATIDLVRSVKDRDVALGYSSVGVVIGVGEGVEDFAVGDRVVSNGNHAEINVVGQRLCARVPDDVGDDQAAFTVVASIALQGIRLADVAFGDVVAVVGLGLVGQLACQLLVANGARVLGFDPDTARAEQARTMGVDAVALTGEQAVAHALAATEGVGVDATLVTASSSSDDIVNDAAQMCRQRGRVVIVGAVGLGLQRRHFYAKEIALQVSCSYGPGRYDDSYELGGLDYPVGFVRWTEQRNFEAVLMAMQRGSIDTEVLTDATYELDEAPDAYAEVVSGDSVGIILRYEDDPSSQGRTAVAVAAAPADLTPRTPRLALVGAGGYAKSVLAPAMRDAGASFSWIVNRSGLAARSLAARVEAEHATTEVEDALGDADVAGVVIATRHDSHARLVLQALRAGKSVFVEKPLCLTREEFDEIAELMLDRRTHDQMLMVGFNRRFAPMIRSITDDLSGDPPRTMTYLCNAGRVPPDHWVHDPKVGGGRLLGEACHFIDLAACLMRSPIASVSAHASPGATPNGESDTAAITLVMENGSVAAIQYFSNGTAKYPKEQCVVFDGGRVFEMDNFRKLRVFGGGRTKTGRAWSQDKGAVDCAAAFVAALRDGGAPPIALADVLNSSLATLAVPQAIASGQTIDIGGSW